MTWLYYRGEPQRIPQMSDLFELRRIPLPRTRVHKEHSIAGHPRFMAVRYTVKMTDSTPPQQRNEQGQEKWYERMRYQILLFTGGIALFVLVGGWILDWYIAPQTSAQKKDLVQALGLITAGVAGAVGIFFTWRGQRLTQESLEDTREVTHENLRVTREGQITERFTRAIDQLGKVEDGQKLFEIRLGGIYALERIARESEEDHWPIMEVLTAYVRQNAPRAPEVRQDGAEDGAVEKSEENTGSSSGESEPVGVPIPEPDIQAVMTVLRRRTRSFGYGEPEPLDLHDTNLTRAVLTKADLSEASLSDATLTKANLSDANLSNANLRGAGLSRAVLRGANLARAYLREADLGGADLGGARHITIEELEQQVKSLEGAIMPNRSMHP